MTRWRPTPALVRSVLVAGTGLAGALLTGSPGVAVLAAPFLVLAVLGVLSRPRTEPAVAARLDHHRLHEGQGTSSRLQVSDLAGVDHVTRVASPAPYVVASPRWGVVGSLVDRGLPALAFGPRRWGRRSIGSERVGLTGSWGAWRWGPVALPPDGLFVLPQAAPYDSKAEVPQPDGLVGAHRSRRVGSGSEFEGIRPFTTGDRLRRISWPVSLRTGELHVVTTRAEQDAGVWLVVDALRDLGRSGGIDGHASSLDLTVRGASALAEHHVRQGDRVGLVVIGGSLPVVPLGSGPRHLHRITGTLSRVRADNRTVPDDALEIRARAGSVVHVLSPMLFTPVVTATATLLRRGAAVVVIDTLGHQEIDRAERMTIDGLARRMRQVERDNRLDRLAALGCPVVRWEGPGTLDEVLHRLARRAQVPKVRTNR